MAVVYYILRAELSRRWRSIVVLVVVAGIAGGAVLTFSSGARRTETAYARFLDASNAAQLMVSPSTHDPIDFAAIAAVPGVAAHGYVIGIELFPDVDSDVVDILGLGSADGRFGYEIDRPNVLSGRLPDVDAANEIFVSRAFADAFAVEAGDRITLKSETGSGSVGPQSSTEDDVSFDVTVAGIGAFSTDIVPTTDLDGLPTVLLPPAFVERVLEESPDAIGFEAVDILVADGAPLGEVVTGVSEVLGEEPFLLERAASHATVERAIRPQATALWAFAAVAATAALLALAQAVARQAAIERGEHSLLAAIGVQRSQLVLKGAAQGGIVGAVGGVLAAGIAAALSPAFPVGAARAAEPNPGIALNLAFAGACVAGLVLVCVAAAGVAVLATTRAGVRDRLARPSGLAALVARAGGSPAAVLGVRRAFEVGTGTATVPVRSGLVTASLALAAVLAATTFAGSLDALVSNPHRYGQTWTVMVDAQFGPAPAGSLMERYARSDDVAGTAGIRYGELGIDGESVPVIGFDRLSGNIELTTTEGRAPARPGEIALGAATLRSIGASVGDRVSVETPAGTDEWTIVGQAVFPQLSLGSFAALGLGTGGVVPAGALPDEYDRSVLEEGAASGDLPTGMEVDDVLVEERSYNAVAIRATPRRERAVAARAAKEPTGDFFFVRTDQRPAAISTYADVRSTPVILAVLLAALAAAMVAHVLVTAVRRRRHELAMCRALGMAGRAVGSVVRWQATTLALVAAAVGLPVGLAGGRVAWRFFAEDLGVPAAATLPWTWLLVAVGSALLVANVAAGIPAWRARRVRPAVVLRTE